MMVRGLFLCLATVAVLGCGGKGGPSTESVSGTVTLDGKPVEGVEVNFVGQDFRGYGKTDANGHYELVQGAVVGENKVYFSKIEGGNIQLNPEAGIDEGQLEAMMMATGEGGANAPQLPKQLIPDEYSDPNNTKLSFPVPEGGTDKADFKLSTN